MLCLLQKRCAWRASCYSQYATRVSQASLAVSGHCRTAGTNKSLGRIYAMSLGRDNDFSTVSRALQASVPTGLLSVGRGLWSRCCSASDDEEGAATAQVCLWLFPVCRVMHSRILGRAHVPSSAEHAVVCVRTLLQWLVFFALETLASRIGVPWSVRHASRLFPDQVSDRTRSVREWKLHRSLGIWVIHRGQLDGRLFFRLGFINTTRTRDLPKAASPWAAAGART